MVNFRSYLPHLSVFLVAVCLYAGTVTHEHVLDDLELIPNQSAVRNPWHVSDILLGRYWGVLRKYDVLYRPLTIWTLGMNYWANGVMGLPGEHPVVYRVTNVLLHALVSFLTCAFFVHLRLPAHVAWVGALLFAAHPIHTEAVAAAVNRSECLALGFGLGMLLLHGRRSGTLWAVFCFMGAMLSKESALLLLPFVVWADWVFQKGWRWKQYGIYAFVMGGWFVLRSVAIGDAVQVVLPLDNPLVAVSFWQRLLTAWWVQSEYVWLQVWPVSLSSDYSHNQIAVVKSFWNVQMMGFVAVVAIGIVVAWRGKRVFPAGLFAIGGYGILFALTANVVLPIGTVMGERLAYGPSLCFCLLVACGICHLPTRVLWPAVIAVILVLSGLTLGRNRVWATKDVFYRAQVASAPQSAKAHYCVARGVYHPKSQLDSAHLHYQRAVTLMPNYPDAWNNLGMVLNDQGDKDGAQKTFETALRWNDGHVVALFNLGQHLQSQGDNDRAVDLYRRVLARNEKHVSACNNLAVLLIQAGKIDTARALLDRALQLDPDDEAAQINREQLRLLEENSGKYGIKEETGPTH